TSWHEVVVQWRGHRVRERVRNRAALATMVTAFKVVGSQGSRCFVLPRVARQSRLWTLCDMDTTVDSGASSDATLFASGSSRDRWHVARATSGLLIGLVRTVSLALNLATAGWAAPMTKGLYL